METINSFAETASGFEGAEKILQFKIASVKPNNGLRGIPQETWQVILDAARCTILNCSKTDYCTAYVLSESSLFVFDNVCIFKTCGKTLLLFALPLVLELLKQKGLQLEYLLYSSKNYLFPAEQLYPHGNWQDAENYLRSFFPEERCTLLGDPTKDHVFLFSYSALNTTSDEYFSGSQSPPNMDWTEPTLLQHECLSPSSSVHQLEDQFGPSDNANVSITDNMYVPGSPVCMPQTSFCEGGLEGIFFNMMMYDMQPTVAKQFFNDDLTKTAATVTRDSGIGSIFPYSVIDDYLFEPCGYSMNGLAMNGFYTIHITPEANCSYASFETNILCSDYTALVEKVLAIFQPKRFSLTFFYHTDMTVSANKSPLCNDSFYEKETGETYDCTKFSAETKCNCIYTLGNYSIRA